MFKRTMLGFAMSLLGTLASPWPAYAQQQTSVPPRLQRRGGKGRAVSHNTGTPRTKHKGQHTNRAARRRHHRARVQGRR